MVFPSFATMIFNWFDPAAAAAAADHLAKRMRASAEETAAEGERG